MLFKAIVAISLGAALGALLRWYFSLKLNGLFPDLPPGTLMANLVGGFIIGFAVVWFSQVVHLAPEWQLFVITGFCGGLTTFSTFSAEVMNLLQQGRLIMAMGVVSVHVVGSLLMTLAGMATCQWFRAALD
jgi:CrcB protein